MSNEAKVNEIKETLIENGTLKEKMVDRFINELKDNPTVIGKININPVTNSQNFQEVKAEVHTPFEIIKDAEEHERDIGNLLIDMVAQRSSLDLEELIIRGGTDKNDLYLELLKGLKYKAKEGVVPSDYHRFCSYHTYFEGKDGDLKYDGEFGSPVALLDNNCILGVSDLNAISFYIDRNINVEAWYEQQEKEYVNEETGERETKLIDVMVFRPTFLIDLDVNCDVVLEKVA